MKRLYHYPVMILLSILSVLCLIVFEATAFVQFVVFQPDIYSEAMIRGNVADIIYNDLVEYFTGFSGPTGIPPEIFIAPLDKDELFEASYSLTVDSLTYLTDSNAAPPAINYDFAKVENYVDAYITQYSQANNIPLDEDFKKLVLNTNATIESQIKGQLDVAMLYQLSQSAYAENIRAYAGSVQTALIISGLMLVFLLMVIVIIDRKHPRDLPYWFGIILFASSLILLIPAAYLGHISYFDRFFMRADNVYNTVTSICNVVLKRVINGETLILVFGVLLILATVIIHMIYMNYLKKHHKEQ